ncbi:MAG: hypothetical protein P8K08_24640 [Fuerstiella sp.]|nr:hypothetical protein [Fuerstiella sp.]
MTLPFLTSHTSSGLLYVALRAAYLTTYQELRDEFESDRLPGSSSGFMAQAPIAAGCAPQVQLDVLFRTWQRIQADREELTLLERCVCFYALGELARLGKADDRQTIERAVNGPKVLECNSITWLASTSRTMQITWEFPVEAAHLQRDVSDFMDDSERSVGVTASRPLTDELLALLGQWTVSTQILENAIGLLTPRESRRLGEFFSEHPRLMNL